MAIHVQCAGCVAKFQAAEKLAGKRVKCPKYGQQPGDFVFHLQAPRQN